MIQFRPALGLSVSSLLALVLLVWLGMWQLERRAWKLELIAAAADRTSQTAVELGDVLQSGMEPERLRYQKLSVTGSFDHSRELFLFFVGPDGPGYKLITPLETSQGQVILIDRGFIPLSKKEPLSRRGGQFRGPQELTGLIRLDGEATLGVREADEATRVWTHRDVRAMAALVGIEKNPVPFFLQVLPQAGDPLWPKPLEPDFSFTNNHLSYALTWFGLAFALISVYIAFHVRQGLLTFGPRSK